MVVSAQLDCLDELLVGQESGLPPPMDVVLMLGAGKRPSPLVVKEAWDAGAVEVVASHPNQSNADPVGRVSDDAVEGLLEPLG